MFPWKQKIPETGILCEIKELLFIPPILHRFWCDFFSLIGIFKAVFHSHFSSFLYKNHWNIVNENFDCQKNSWNHLILKPVNCFHELFSILCDFILFPDAIREMNKYSDESNNSNHGHPSHLDAQVNCILKQFSYKSKFFKTYSLNFQMQMHMRLFRAQRNFYISGFALFLCL